jgi:hypothetical protein
METKEKIINDWKKIQEVNKKRCDEFCEKNGIKISSKCLGSLDNYNDSRFRKTYDVTIRRGRKYHKTIFVANSYDTQDPNYQGPTSYDILSNLQRFEVNGFISFFEEYFGEDYYTATENQKIIGKEDYKKSKKSWEAVKRLFSDFTPYEWEVFWNISDEDCIAGIRGKLSNIGIEPYVYPYIDFYQNN